VTIRVKATAADAPLRRVPRCLAKQQMEPKTALPTALSAVEVERLAAL
jgi:hypothetical protein